MQLYLLFLRSFHLFSAIIALLLFVHLSSACLPSAAYVSAAANKEDVATDSVLLDPLGFQAIQALHLQLDDDRDGQVDIAESDEFLREELEYTDGHERQKALHRNKKSVTVHELWESWRKSEVHNWTVQETVEWLETYVELPQYAKSFLDNQVDGSALPRLASNMSYLSQILGIKDAIHRRKLSIKAMDAVLFGPHKHHNFLKDALLVTFLLIAVGGIWLAYMQHVHSQKNMGKMLRDIEKLQKMEDSLGDLQQELDIARQKILEKENLEKQQNDDNEVLGIGREDMGEACTTIGLLQDELKRAREELLRRPMEHSSWTPPPALQLWLQLTYELEMLHFNNRKKTVWAQLQAAKEACEKLGKNRYNFFKFIQTVHSNGSSNDDVDGRIDQTKNSVKELEREMKDRSERWRHIEMLCGFPIVINPGLVVLEKKLRNGGSHFGPLQFLHANQDELDDRESLQRYTLGTSSASVPATYMTTPLGWAPELVQRPQQHTLASATNPVPAISPNGHIVGNSMDVPVHSPMEPALRMSPSTILEAGSSPTPDFLVQNSPRQSGNRPATLSIRGSSSDNNLTTNVAVNSVTVGSFTRNQSSLGHRAAFIIGESPSLEPCLDTSSESVSGASSPATSTSVSRSSPIPSQMSSASVCEAQVKASDSSMAWRKTKSRSHDQSSMALPREQVLPGQRSEPSLAVNGTGVGTASQAAIIARGGVNPLHKSVSAEEDKSSDSSSTTTVASLEKKKKKTFFGGRKLKLRH